jgi:hypothetical protein
MAPFFAAGVFWLAGPCALGVLVVGVARLARRAAAASVEARAPHAERQVRIAGLLAGAVLVLSDTVLINAGSRFPHIWVCAMFVWAMEAICIVTSGPSPSRQVRWGVVLGLSLAWLLATRHVDGALLGVGMFLYVLYAFVRGRLALRTAIATLVPFALLGGLALVLLRLQLGKWFTTGYSLTEIIHPWNKGASALSLPKPNEWRWSFPIDAGSYCWWPMAPAIGIAGGLALGRTRERRLAFMMGLGTTMNAGLYALLESCRGWDFGYGPRYHLVVIVPMAVGAAVVFAPMFNAALAHVARYTTLADGGAAALAATAALLGVIRIAPLVYPANTDDIHARNVVFDAIKQRGPAVREGDVPGEDLVPRDAGGPPGEGVTLRDRAGLSASAPSRGARLARSPLRRARGPRRGRRARTSDRRGCCRGCRRGPGNDPRGHGGARSPALRRRRG